MTAERLLQSSVARLTAYDCQARAAVRPTLVSIAVPYAERLAATYCHRTSRRSESPQADPSRDVVAPHLEEAHEDRR